MTDLFPLELYQQREVRRIDINYVNEVLFGEKVDIVREQQKPDGCLFEMRRNTAIICRASMQFDGCFDLMENK